LAGRRGNPFQCFGKGSLTPFGMTQEHQLMKILVISSKTSWADRRLAQEARKAKVNLRFLSGNELKGVSPEAYDVLYIRNPYVNTSPRYLPNIVKLAKQFKRAGKKVVDNIIANGNIGQGKWLDYQALKKANLPIPKTKVLPAYKLPATSYPLVLKWIYGMKGKNVFLVRNKQQLQKLLPLHPKKEWLVQEFIRADYEYKVITVGYKALPVVQRFTMKSSGLGVDFDSARSVPIHRRSRTPINGHATLIKIAEAAAKLLGRELAKVDILQKGKRFYILEVNRFPGLEWYEKLTKVNATKAFLEYLPRSNSPK